MPCTQFANEANTAKQNVIAFTYTQLRVMLFLKSFRGNASDSFFSTNEDA